MYQKNFGSRAPRPKPTNMIIGFRAIMEAIEAGKDFDKVMLQKGLKGELHADIKRVLIENQIPIQQVPIEKLDGLTKANHQGIIGFTSPIGFYELSDLIQRAFESARNPKFIYLDGVTDVRNFGAICRSAECSGFDGVIIPEKGSAQINEEAVKTSAGALFHIPIARTRSVVETIKILQESGISLVGCTEKTDQLIQQVDLTRPTCIIMGAEDTGISDEFIRKADALGKVHMEGKTSSMNVSVAAGIIMYELNRQRLV